MPSKLLYTPDGLPLRFGHWPCKSERCRGTVVLLGGRSEFIEKYHETIGEIHTRGLDAFSLDWRGQGLSGRMLDDTSKGYVESYRQYVNDLKLMYDEVLLPICRKPLFILAHSMGANIALHYLRQFSQHMAKAVLIAPMIGIHTRPSPPAVIRWISHWMVRIGWHWVKVPTPWRSDPFSGPFEHNRLTSDRSRFDAVKIMLKEKPHLAVTSITFGWLAATFNAIKRLRQPGFAQNVQLPVLIVSAGQDRVVSNAAMKRFVRRLPHGQLQIIPGARHEILQERDILRAQFWRLFDQFIQ